MRGTNIELLCPFAFRLSTEGLTIASGGKSTQQDLFQAEVYQMEVFGVHNPRLYTQVVIRLLHEMVKYLGSRNH